MVVPTLLLLLLLVCGACWCYSYAMQVPRFSKQLRSLLDAAGELTGLALLILFQCLFLLTFAALGYSYAKSSAGNDYAMIMLLSSGSWLIPNIITSLQHSIAQGHHLWWDIMFNCYFIDGKEYGGSPMFDPVIKWCIAAGVGHGIRRISLHVFDVATGRPYYDLWRMPFFISAIPNAHGQWSRPSISFGSSILHGVIQGAVMIDYRPESGTRERTLTLSSISSSTCNQFLDYVCRNYDVSQVDPDTQSPLLPTIRPRSIADSVWLCETQV